MKKHLIAAAVAAAVAVPAAAQVKISGTIDINVYGQTKATTEATTPVTTKTTDTGNDNGFATPELVFSGSEDLGGGLKAGFKFSAAIAAGDIDAGDRDQFISLGGGFGAARFGRFTPASEGILAKFGGGGTTSQMGSIDSNGSLWTARTAAGDFGRGDNVIEYKSATFSGLQVTASYKLDKTSTSGTSTVQTNANQQDISVTYKAGALEAAVSMASRENQTNSTTKSETEMDVVGASYNLGMASVTAVYSNLKADTSSVQTNQAKIYGVGFTLPLGATTLKAMMYDGEDKMAGGADGIVNLDGYQISAVYTLSKRTSLYAVTGLSESDDADTVNKAKNSSYGLGIVHKF